MLVPDTEDFDSQSDQIHFLGCNQLCVTKVKPKAFSGILRSPSDFNRTFMKETAHMIFDIKFPNSDKSDIVVEK